MLILEHITAIVLSVSALLQVIAIGNGTSGLYYAGSGIAIVTSVGSGLTWLLSMGSSDIFRIIFVAAITMYFLWVLLIPMTATAMLVLSWLTFFVVSGSLWLIRVNSKWGLTGILVSFLVLQLGYTLFGSGTSRPGAIASVVIGWIGSVGSFYYDRRKHAAEEGFNSKIVLVEDGTPAVAVGFIDYGATSKN